MQEYIILTKESANFEVKSTLDCGQIFRYFPYKKGYKVISADKCAYLYHEGEMVKIKCLKSDGEYFYNFFDLDRDYLGILESAKKQGISILNKAVELGKGIRILNQEKIETTFSFIISQNNNIPRIKGIIEKLCQALGEKKEFLGEQFYAFPTVQKMSNQPLSFYEKIGLGYRAKYIKKLADELASGFNIEQFSDLSTSQLKKQLLSIYGIGEKVAECILLFAFHRSDSFPVDTWIEKVYKEDMQGQLKNRAKISEYLVDRFKENAGYYQQYLFYYKRLTEKSD